jgi:transcriptional regulator with XRE-family HTH domain
MSRPSIYTDSPLFRLRQRLGLSQVAFAECIGVSHSTERFIETGRLSLTATVLTKVLGHFGAVWDAQAGDWVLSRYVPENVGKPGESYNAQHYERFRSQLSRPTSKEEDRQWMEKILETISEQIPPDRWEEFKRVYTGTMESMALDFGPSLREDLFYGKAGERKKQATEKHHIYTKGVMPSISLKPAKAPQDSTEGAKADKPHASDKKKPRKGPFPGEVRPASARRKKTPA